LTCLARSEISGLLRSMIGIDMVETGECRPAALRCMRTLWTLSRSGWLIAVTFEPLRELPVIVRIIKLSHNPNPCIWAHKSGPRRFSLFLQRLTRSYQKALARRPLSMNLQVVQRSETKELILGEAFSSLCGVGLNDRCNISYPVRSF
jgi:hypothetical protein